MWLRLPHASALGLALTLGAACAAPPPAAPVQELTDQARHRADSDRNKILEREVERLRSDLQEAEQALIAAESGLRGERTRADAVTALAEARIQLDRARASAPWERDALAEAADKSAESERQLEAGRYASAVFFARRAERVAKRAVDDAESAAADPDARHIHGDRVNLREAPNTEAPVITVLVGGTPVFPETDGAEWVLVRTAAGRVGWVYGSLLR